MEERRKLETGDLVIFIDAYRNRRHALVTKVWNSVGNLPGCNLVATSNDETKGDLYGRQIERFTSVVHGSQQPAGGMCWWWPGETPPLTT